MAAPTRQTAEARWPEGARSAQMLLAVATGAVNAISYLTLGGVFTSVMTANTALLGLALGTGERTILNLAAVAIAAYLAGVAAGSWIASAHGRPWLTGLCGAMCAECVVLWAVWVVWLSVDGHPGGTQRAALLAAGAAAMGCQSGSIRVALGSNVTTGYLTGAMTGVVARLVSEGRFQRRTALIIVLLPAGAALGGAAVRWANPVAPAVPALLVSVAVLVTARGLPARTEGAFRK